MFLFNDDIGSELTGTLYIKLYRKAYKEFFNESKADLGKIEKYDRNKNYIIVMPYSFLGERHAPTRTTLERVYTLGRMLGKKY